jgi:SAM-dependent methyltransferase
MVEITDFYRDEAPSGAQVSSPHQQEILETFLASALGGRRIGVVLDFGSGRGSNAATLARHAERVVTADVSMEALADGLIRNPSVAGRLMPVVVPGRGLPFPDEAFSVTVCTEVLEHVEDVEHAARELQRVTARGGHLIISTPNYGNVMGVIKWVKDKRSGRQDYDPWHAHAGGYERPMTTRWLLRLFPDYRIEAERGADYAFALGIVWSPLRWRLSRYLLLRPGTRPGLARFGMQYYVLLRKP